MTEYHPRDITDAVSTDLENTPVVVVTGMRQTSKTTFLCSQSELGNRSYVSKDLAGPRAFLEATPHCKAAILCHNGENAVRLGQKLWSLPISLMLS